MRRRVGFFCAASAGGQHAARGRELPSQAVLQQNRERHPWGWTGPSKPNCPLIPEAPFAPKESRPRLPGLPRTRGCQQAWPHHSPESRLLPAQACPQRGSSPSFLPLSPHKGFFQRVVKKKKEATHPAVRARLFIPAETTPAFSPPAPQRAGGEPGKEALTLQARACWSIIRSLSRRRGTRRLIWSATRPRWRVVQAPWPRQHWPHCLLPGADKPVPAEPLQTAIKCASSLGIRTRCAKLAASRTAGQPRPITLHEVLAGRSSSKLLAPRRGKAPGAERALERPR